MSSPNPFAHSSAEKEQQKTKQETSTKAPLAFLDENDQIGYSLLLRPVRMRELNVAKFFEKGKAEKAQELIKKVEEKSGKEFQYTKATGSKESLAKLAEKDRNQRITETLASMTQAELVSTGSFSSQNQESGAYICMPLPIAIRDAVNVQYSQADLGSLGAGLQLGQDAFQSYQDSGSVVEGIKTGLVGGGNYLLRTLLATVSDSAGAFLQKGTGNVPNPFSVTLFEKVQLRTFNFEWVLQPKSQDEAERLRRIINLIRYYALPNVTGLFIDVPYEWEIAFLGTDSLYAFSRCVLENMETNFSVNGFPVFMEDDSPQAISLTLTFKEIYPLTKQSVVNGPDSMKPVFGDGFEQAVVREEHGDPPTEAEAEKNVQQQTVKLTTEQQIQVLSSETAQLKAEMDRIRKTGDADLQEQFELVKAQYNAKQIQLIDLQRGL